MRAYELTHELVCELNNSPEYIAYCADVNRLIADERNKALFDEYLTLTEKESANNPEGVIFTDSDEERLAELREMFDETPEFKQTLDAKAAYDSIFTEIIKTLVKNAGASMYEIVRNRH